MMGCTKEVEDKGPPPPPNPYTKVIFQFTHNVNGADILDKEVKYENASGNIYGVDNIKYLVGRIRLDSWDSPEPVYIEEYHLIDLSDPTTLTFSPKDTILIDDYENITLFLGFDESKNITGNYPDLDNKAWGFPPKYGGGYYTLRMEGNYLSTAASTVTNTYNIAIGGNRREETMNDTMYVPNPIYATASEGFEIPTGTKVVKVELRMDLNRLFVSNVGVANFNLDTYPSNLEESATGTATLSENVAYAFKLGAITLDDAATGN